MSQSLQKQLRKSKTDEYIDIMRRAIEEQALTIRQLSYDKAGVERALKHTKWALWLVSAGCALMVCGIVIYAVC